jgi:hypothetical protein
MLCYVMLCYVMLCYVILYYIILYYPPIYTWVSKVVSFPSGFSVKTLCTPLLFPIRATCPAHLILLDFITRTILGEQLSSSLCCTATLCATNFAYTSLASNVDIRDERPVAVRKSFVFSSKNIFMGSSPLQSRLVNVTYRYRLWEP